MPKNNIIINFEVSGAVIVVDFDGVMVHIFSRQMRDFYGLDNLWADAKKIDLRFNPEKGNDSDGL